MKPRADKSNFSSKGPSSAVCSGDRVDVWQVELDQPVPTAQMNSVLSVDELDRASQFRFERDRSRFIRCRTALRLILGRYLGMTPGEIQLEYQTGGKPELATQQDHKRLRFNASHSANLALIAVTMDHRLGVDIEKIRADVEVEVLSERFFSARECAGLQSLPENLRLQAFFACWTRKEAFLKAIGLGLSIPLSDFSVSTHPNLNPAIEEIRGDTTAAQDWLLADLTSKEGYRASLAVEGLPACVKTYRWS